MKRSFYLDLAASGLRMPIGTDLLLREREDGEAALHDGRRLGEVVVASARRWGTPLAFPLMDLRVEKEDLARMLGVRGADVDEWHVTSLTPAVVETVRDRMGDAPTVRLAANAEALRYVAKHADLVPVGMAIGPFSLMTKLLSDPITPVFLAGNGATAAEDEEVATVEAAIEAATLVIERSLRLQCGAGAKAVCVCEPAANQVYLSPQQIAGGSDVFERYVMAPNRRLKAVLDECGTDLIFHDCGELTDEMVTAFGTLDPAMLSLGSSRDLTHDAGLIPKTTVLFGNLPSKRFYSDAELPVEAVESRSAALVESMRRVGHPFILGSECDVLSVPGSHDTIVRKVHAMLGCCRSGGLR